MRPMVLMNSIHSQRAQDRTALQPGMLTDTGTKQIWEDALLNPMFLEEADLRQQSQGSTDSLVNNQKLLTALLQRATVGHPTCCGFA